MDWNHRRTPQQTRRNPMPTLRIIANTELKIAEFHVDLRRADDPGSVFDLIH
jgi:hypothetical protein